MPSVENSPYPLGIAVVDPRLLQSRRLEIEAAVEVLADTSDGRRHALFLGEQRSGRSTVVQEVGRRMASGHSRLVVTLYAENDALTERAGLHRCLLITLVEALGASTKSAWYDTWRDRVHLRDQRPSGADDLLSSALTFAVDPGSALDRPILERDLRRLREIAASQGFEEIVVCVDDASPLTEDTEVVEELVSIFDLVGGFRLLLAAFPSTAGHFLEAASPCLSRFVPIRLRPFRNLRQIFTSLSAPLEGRARTWVRSDDTAFLRDLLRLTSGNPYELMLVANQLWLACQQGEQDHYSLTTKILDRVIPHLARLAAGGDALLDGAVAIDRLPDEQAKHAVELVAFSRLSFRQIAIAKTLEIDSRDSDRVDRAILDADLDSRQAAVRSQVADLEAAGVVQMHADGEHFGLVGGRPAEVVLKYKARSRIGIDASRQPFQLGFVSAVGRALARDLAVRTLDLDPASTSLGYSSLLSIDGASRLSPRAAVSALDKARDFERLAQAELDIIPWSPAQFDRISELLGEESPVVALVYTRLSDGRDQLEYTELWELAAGSQPLDLANRLSSVIEEWEPVVAAADLVWDGCESAVLHGEDARTVLVILQRYAATNAVHTLFERWFKERDSTDLSRAQRISAEAVHIMRKSGLSDSQLSGELSGMLSRAAFLSSFDDNLLEDAARDLESALEIGAADTWVTKWNLANVTARSGDFTRALEVLDAVEQENAGWHGYAFGLFWCPGRPAVESLVRITDGGVGPIIALQRAVIRASRGDGTDELERLVTEYLESEEPVVVEVASWADKGRTSTAQT